MLFLSPDGKMGFILMPPSHIKASMDLSSIILLFFVHNQTCLVEFGDLATATVFLFCFELSYLMHDTVIWSPLFMKMTLNLSMEI